MVQKSALLHRKEMAPNVGQVSEIVAHDCAHSISLVSHYSVSKVTTAQQNSALHISV